MSSSWTPKSRFRDKGWHMKKNIMGTLCVLCLLTLTACGQSGLFGSDDDAPKAPAPSAAPTVSESLPALQAPPGSADRPAPLGTTGAPRTPDGLPALQPLKGVNANQLFTDELSDPDDRLDRLENAVQEIRNDMDTMAPSIIRLIAIEADIQNLIEQLEMLLSSEPPPPAPVPAAPVSAAPVSSTAPPSAPVALADPGAVMEDPDAAYVPPAQEGPQASAAPVPITAQGTPPPEPAQPQAPSPALAPGEVAVLDMRVGEHPDKTRIVLDVSGKTSFTADLDNSENLLLVELANATWRAPASTRYPRSKLLVSHVAERTGDGPTLLIVQLKSGASILSKSTLKGKDGTGQRIVIDLAAEKSAATQ